MEETRRKVDQSGDNQQANYGGHTIAMALRSQTQYPQTQTQTQYPQTQLQPQTQTQYPQTQTQYPQTQTQTQYPQTQYPQTQYPQTQHYPPPPPQPQTNSNHNTPPPTAEDQQFLSLAKEALEATRIVDPTISDLLTRLQYASSPHGNPIKSGGNIQTNENGQLMIQEFYNSFPNMDNNIFTGSQIEPERKYGCDKCDMMFKRSSDLKRHEKQHLDIPANICDLCGKGFARKDALKRHSGTATCKRNAEKGVYKENLEAMEK